MYKLGCKLYRFRDSRFQEGRILFRDGREKIASSYDRLRRKKNIPERPISCVVVICLYRFQSLLLLRLGRAHQLMARGQISRIALQGRHLVSIIPTEVSYDRLFYNLEFPGAPTFLLRLHSPFRDGMYIGIEIAHLGGNESTVGLFL